MSIKKIIRYIGCLVCFIGLAIPLIGGASSVVEYQYVHIDELNETEKQSIVYATPSGELPKTPATYYLVYRFAATGEKTTAADDTHLSALPQTGAENTIVWSVLTIVLFGSAVVLYKKGKINTSIVLILCGAGVLSIPTVTQAARFTQLSMHNEIFSVTDATAWPRVKILDGYEYVGYFSEVKGTETDSTPDKDNAGNGQAVVSIVEQEKILLYTELPVQYETDPTLEKGQTKTVEGKNGKEVITYEVTYVSGMEVSRKEVKRDRVEATPTVVYVGTKVDDSTGENPTPPKETDHIEKKIKEVVVVVPYETTSVEDHTLPVGTVTEEGGENGTINKIYEETYVNGVLTKTEFIRDEIIKLPVPKVITTGTALKAIPHVTIDTVETNSLNRSITATYILSDDDQAYKRAVARIYKGEEIVKEVVLPAFSDANNTTLTIDDLERNTPYVLKVYTTYNRGVTDEEQLESTTHEFILEDKFVELKRITNIELEYKNQKVLNLKAAPQDVTEYLTRVSIEGMPDVLLQVVDIAETSRDGQSVFKVKAMMPQLVQEQNGEYEEGFTFYIPKVENVAGTYTTFSDLIEAIRQDPSGTFVLGADLLATEADLVKVENGVETTLAHYIEETFTGTLIGESNQQTFAIYGLKAPLFKQTNGATIRSIDFKDVAIQSTVEQIGTVVGVTENTRIENVAVKGSLEGPGNIGGIASRVTKNSVLSNVSFEGTITVTKDADNYSGGIAGAVNSSSLVEKAYANVQLTGRATSGGKRLAGLVGGLVDRATLKDSYVEGVIHNTGNTNGQVGGITGSLWQRGIVTNVISMAKVINGNRVNGDKGDTGANITQAFYVEGYAKGNQDTLTRTPIAITKEEADSKIASLGITATTADTNRDNGVEATDYAHVSGYQADREHVYKNMEKLLPYYTKPIIVEYGNKVATASHLYIKEVQSTVLLKDNGAVYDLGTNKESANGLLIAYTDGTVDKHTVSYIGTFKDTLIQEYAIDTTGLMYTPRTLGITYGAELDTLIEELTQLDYMNDVIKVLRPNYQYFFYQKLSQSMAMGYNPNNSTENVAKANQDLIDANVDPYYLKPAFDANKAELKKHIISMLENDQLTDTTTSINPTQRLEYIRQNKEKILLGLAYMTRWYSVQINGANLADFTMYHKDIFGDKQSSIDFLIEIGSIPLPSNIDNDLLMSNNTANAYEQYIANKTGISTISSYLEYYKNIFDTPSKDMNTWFKETTKALIHEEQPSLPELSHVNVSIWAALNKTKNDRNMILPLLVMQHRGVGISLTMSTMILSMIDKYYKLPDGAAHYDDATEIIEGMQNILATSAKHMRLNAEMWYRILPDSEKADMYSLDITPVKSYDGYNALSGNGRGWMLATAEGEAPRLASNPYATDAVTEFFAPMKKWIRPNGLGAYANGTEIWYIVNNAMDKYGSSVMTHELVHNLDGRTYLSGFGRRSGMGAEDYAQGLLQSINVISTHEDFGLNTDTDYTTYNNGADLSKRLHNATPERFQTQDDVQQYLKGTYDVLYLLNYAEAEEMLELDKADLRYLINKVEMIADGDHYKERLRQFTDDEWNAASFTSINDLIDQQAFVGVLNNSTRATLDIGRNTYYGVNRFYANYGTYTTDKGGPGSRTFKQNAFELFAAAGYEGFVNYTSNKLSSVATSEGEVFSDAFILKKTFNGAYPTYNDFRKAMYAQRYAKRATLIPFVYNNVTYTTYDELRQLMETAIQQDLQRAKKGNYSSESVKNLKREIFRYYLIATDDFRTSIFGE